MTFHSQTVIADINLLGMRKPHLSTQTIDVPFSGARKSHSRTVIADINLRGMMKSHSKTVKLSSCSAPSSSFSSLTRRSRSGLTMLSRQSVETYQRNKPTQLLRELGYSRLSSLSLCGPILAREKSPCEVMKSLLPDTKGQNKFT